MSHSTHNRSIQRRRAPLTQPHYRNRRSEQEFAGRRSVYSGQWSVVSASASSLSLSMLNASTHRLPTDRS